MLLHLLLGVFVIVLLLLLQANSDRGSANPRTHYIIWLALVLSSGRPLGVKAVMAMASVMSARLCAPDVKQLNQSYMQ